MCQWVVEAPLGHKALLRLDRIGIAKPTTPACVYNPARNVAGLFVPLFPIVLEITVMKLLNTPIPDIQRQ